MSLAKTSGPVGPRRLIACVLLGLVMTAGCGIRTSTSEQMLAFEQAGPVRIEVDSASLVKAKLPPGAYRVVPGDMLELQMPEILRAISPDFPAASSIQPVHVRVSDAGTISLPLTAEMAVAGKTFSEIEAQVVAAYYPAYMKRPASVVAQVVEYRTSKITVVGAVEEPGVYELRSDEMSLVALLMKAGGVIKEGAGVAYIHQERGDEKREVVLPVKGLNVPFADVALQGGETVEIKRLDPQIFTVIGLVRKAGSFPYPPGGKYTLLQALGFAGGVDDIADPQYVKVYRQDAEGELVAAVFKIGQVDLAKTANIEIRPGDCVSVEHTARTRTRKTLAGIFGAGIYGGATYSLAP